MRPYDIALCTLAFAAILLPSSATCPSFTSPAAWHNLSTWTNRSLKAFRWRRRNLAMVRKSGWFIAVTAMKSTRSSQAWAIRRIEAAAIGIEQQRHHHGRMVRRVAPLLVIGRKDRAQIQFLPHRVAHEMRHVSGRNQFMDRRRQQPPLFDIPRTKGFAHGPT